MMNRVRDAAEARGEVIVGGAVAVVQRSDGEAAATVATVAVIDVVATNDHGAGNAVTAGYLPRYSFVFVKNAWDVTCIVDSIGLFFKYVASFFSTIPTR